MHEQKPIMSRDDSGEGVSKQALPGARDNIGLGKKKSRYFMNMLGN
jgi:hypothetical protein